MNRFIFQLQFCTLVLDVLSTVAQSTVLAVFCLKFEPYSLLFFVVKTARFMVVQQAADHSET